MVYLDIERGPSSKRRLQKLDDLMGNKNNKVFILIFMEGCRPCGATRPEWKKLENVLPKDFLKRDDIVIASVDTELADGLKNLATKASSFPTMRFMTDGGKKVENYEDSDIEKKDHTIDSFVEWIKLKTNSKMTGGKTKKVRKARKWSSKYKRTINCRRPRGFSQKQYCKYGRRK